MITTDRQPVYLPLRPQKICLADEAEFNEIVRDHSARLIRIVVCLTKNQHTAEDIVQETFLKLWENRATLTPENVGGWLYRVAWNLSLGHIRKEAGRTKLHTLWTDIYYHSAGVEEQLFQKENTKVFKKIYDSLPEKQQAVYHLSKIENLSRMEIAQQLNISPHTVKNHLAKAVQFMKEHLGAIALFLLCFVLNNIFFNRTSTKSRPVHLYIKQQTENKKPVFALRSNVAELTNPAFR